MTNFFVGTSGYSYPAWKGLFYPEKLSAKKMLAHYAEHFSTVETNNTFRKLPDISVTETWAEQVPAAFRFALKAPQQITHFRRLKDVQTQTEDLLRFAAALKGRCGPLLFQLPHNFKKDVARLQAFLKLLPKKSKSAFEFRHESWFDEEVYACLRKHHCALCLADTDELPIKDLISTASWGYLRLRRKNYTSKQLEKWVAMIQEQNWREVYVYFMHEDTGTGPKFAARLLKQTAP